MRIKSKLQRTSTVTGPNADRTLGQLLDATLQLIEVVNGRLSRGQPDDGLGAPQHDNLEGVWVTLVLTAAADLGTGANSPLTVTHNLGLQTSVVPGQSYNYPNVLWSIARVVVGDRTGANGAPTPTANATHVSCHFVLGDSVTEDAIELRVHSDITPSATDPITIDLWVEPAVI